MLAKSSGQSQNSNMIDGGGELSGSRPTLEVVDIEPGQQIILVTQSGALYEIDEIREVEGMIQSTVRQRPATQDAEGTPTRTIDDAFLITWPEGYAPHSMRQIYMDASLEVIGFDRATQERVDFKTSPIRSIASERII